MGANPALAGPVLCVVGARPNFMKMAPLLAAFARAPELPRAVLVHTGQHYDASMSDRLFADLRLPAPDLNLEVGSGTHAVQTAEIMRRFEPIVDEFRPSAVLVVGDVNSTLACGLVAVKKHVPVAHVEAGLRSYDKFQPFPEEINRRLVSHIGDWHFPPTEGARQNLLREGLPAERIVVTGNTVIDALLATVRPDYRFDHPALSRLDFAGRRVVLATTHRRENWGGPLREVCHAIRAIVERHADVDVIYAVHLNPQVQRVVRAELGDVPRVHLLEPLDYEPFVQLMSRCHLILTDSGGIQEEAPSLGKPVLVLRNVTERPEGAQAGTLKIVGTDRDVIVREAGRLLTDPAEYRRMATAPNPYGDGQASRRIADVLAQLRRP